MSRSLLPKQFLPRVETPGPHHGDAFDRLLIAQALEEKLPLDTHAAIWFALTGAIAHRATLATADARLLKWKHPLKRQDARR